MKIINKDLRSFKSPFEALEWLQKNDSERRLCLTVKVGHEVKINLVGKAKDLSCEILRISDISIKDLVVQSSVTRTYFLSKVGKTDYVYSVLESVKEKK